MATQSEASSAASTQGLPAKQVYAIAAICLLLGLFVGYFFLAGPSRPTLAGPQPFVGTHPSSAGTSGTLPRLTL